MVAIAVMVGSFLGAPQTASAFESDVKQDLALWSLAFVNHDLGDNWSVSFQTEVRAKDEVTSLDEAIFKAGGYHRFNDWLELGIGYKYIYKNDGSNENIAWEELYVKHPFGLFGFTHQTTWSTRGPDRFPASSRTASTLASASTRASTSESSSATCGVTSSSVTAQAKVTTSFASSCISPRMVATPPAEGASLFQWSKVTRRRPSLFELAARRGRVGRREPPVAYQGITFP
ncbi:MAG: DUF2490 domain-containing protein [Deltaproteobacteria bacterium]|nr:DUF2490 domain-containing protein [Deltaproteobacteria bacterium]